MPCKQFVVLLNICCDFCSFSGKKIVILLNANEQAYLLELLKNLSHFAGRNLHETLMKIVGYCERLSKSIWWPMFAPSKHSRLLAKSAIERTLEFMKISKLHSNTFSIFVLEKMHEDDKVCEY